MTDTTNAVAIATAEDTIICHIDNARCHSVQQHIKENHAGSWTIDRYKAEFPDAPVLSEFAKQYLARRLEEKRAATPSPAIVSAAAMVTTGGTLTARLANFHELFGLGAVPAAMSSMGNPISVQVMEGHDENALLYLPEIDNSYVFNIDLLKKVIIGFELRMNVYLWGLHGTGKTTLLKQAAARTRRPFVRVQHTINMQESEVLGQWTVRDGATHFQLGPLPMAMLNGWIYCADEYDFAMPAVTAVYQPVLEGEPLLIKDAPPQFRLITPHPAFRFCATGNTNGVGDETGLYQGTMVQNAANYSRFHITAEVDYMEEKIEAAVLCAKADVEKSVALKIVKYANQIRQSFRDGKISMTVSPRELINAGAIGMAYGANWQIGLEMAFSNRLSRIDRKVATELAQRIFA